ncbi:MAG TPA: hypothetical protein VHX36_08870 [Candidatus Acidoferrales bacterium]|jgi:hypothetical protein|nr:hypothetical protein [Candidatus Acidoferrales bacterium]
MPAKSVGKYIYQSLGWLCTGALAMALIMVLRKSPEPNVPYDPAAAARVEQKLAAADQAKAAGQPAQVAIDRTELNSYLQQNLQLQGSSAANAASVPSSVGPGSANALPASDGSSTGGAGGTDGTDGAGSSAAAYQLTQAQVASSVKDVQVDMDGDLVKAHVIFNLHGKDMSLDLDGHLVSEDGYLKFEPVDGKLGSLPLPQSVLDAAVDKLMSSPENRDKMKLPDGISDIQIQNGQAVVSYK